MHLLLNDRGSERASDLLDSGKTRSPAARKALARVSTVVNASVFKALRIISICRAIASESGAASLPLCITSATGLSTTAYGFIDGLHQAVHAFLRIGGGWAVDRADRPKRIAFTGYGLSNLAKIRLLFASGFASIIAVVAVDRIGRSIRRASQDFLVTASSGLADLGYSFGLHRMLDTIGAAFGPLLAFLVLFFLATGYTILFVISVTLAASGVIMLGLLEPDKRSRRKWATAVRPAPSRWRDLNDSRLPRRTTVAGLLGGAIIYENVAISGYQARISALRKVSTTTAVMATGSPRIVVRKTAAGKGCWLLASVPLGNPKSTRMVSTIPCDHVYQTGNCKMSLRIDHGVVTAFAANVLDNSGKKRHLWALPGLLSRTRISPDSQLFSFPTLVTREAYVRAGFAVATQISFRAGHDYGNLATGAEKYIPDRRGIDDQVRWIDDSTLLCSARRDSTAGDCDIWSSPMNDAAAPKLFNELTWSPSVAI